MPNTACLSNVPKNGDTNVDKDGSQPAHVPAVAQKDDVDGIVTVVIIEVVDDKGVEVSPCTTP